jgi:hypothetical protein
MPELFSLIVPSLVSSAASWAAKTFLDTLTGCPNCGRSQSACVSNGAANHLTCYYCSNALNQYNVMTRTTVSQNGQVMGANIFHPHFQTDKDGIIFKKYTNWFMLDLDTVGMHNQAAVVKGRFREANGHRSWEVPEIYLNNPYERTSYKRVAWNITDLVGSFPAHKPILAEFKVLNLNKDVLHSVSPVETFAPIR